MKTLTFSWYWGIVAPQSLAIGPGGHDCPEWKELESVATPTERQANPFYMEGEAACVMNRHNLNRVVQPSTRARDIHYSNISYTVPGVEVAAQVFTPEYFKAQENLRNQFLANL